MAQLTVQSVSFGPALGPSYGAAAAGGDSFPNATDETTFLVVKNGSASPITATINPVITSAKVPGVGTLTVAAISESVPASGERWIGPFPVAFNEASGLVNVTYSAVTTVTVAAVRVPKKSQ